MNIKSILAALSIVGATATGAMADVHWSGSVSGSISGGAYVNSGYRAPAPVVVVRDHRTTQPVYVRDTVQNRWEGRWTRPAPQPHYDITCNEQSFTSLASASLPGTKDSLGSVDFNMRGVGRLNELSFAWTYGNTIVKDIVVTYADGRNVRYYLGDALTANPGARQTRTVQLDGGRVVNVRVIGYSYQSEGTSTFQVLGRA